MQDDGPALLHRRRIEQPPAGLQVDQAGHFAVIDRVDRQSAGDPDAVEKDVVIRSLYKNVGSYGTGCLSRPGLGRSGEEALQDLDDSLGSPC